MPLANPQKPPSRRPGAPGVLLVAVALAALSATGCTSLGSANPLTLWRMGLDKSLSSGPTPTETGDNRGLMARWIKPKAPPGTNANGSTLVLGSNGWQPMKAEANPEADKEVKAALTLVKQGKLDDAEKAFAAIAKNRKGTPWGEKSQYYLAETQLQHGHLVKAHDSYDQLYKDYQGTEYLTKLVQREWELAQLWLAQSDPKTPADKKLPWQARFDGREPFLDVHGNGLRALEHVRHHNPTGELADDAVLRIADEHMAMRDYDSAALYYDQLLIDHPKSPYIQRVQLAVIDARMKAYVGPEYDGAGLEKARDMVKQTMMTFPDNTAGSEKLYHTLDLINDQEAERTYVRGDYYRRAGYPASAEYYFAKIPQVWPKSTWAAKAKVQLASLAKVPRKLHDPSKIMSQPGSTDPMLGGMGNMGNPGGMGNGMGMGNMGGMGGMGGMQ